MFTDDLPSKANIVEFWKDRLSDHGFAIDWTKPACWACGFDYGGRYNLKATAAAWDKILRRWNRIPLQRCHILPRALGGNPVPDNLFLMCRECHDSAPNTNMPEIFFQWAKNQDWQKRDVKKIRDAFEAFGIIAVEEMQDYFDTMHSEAFRRWAALHAGFHRPQSNYASNLSRVTPATLIGLATRYRAQAEINPYRPL